MRYTFKAVPSKHVALTVLTCLLLSAGVMAQTSSSTDKLTPSYLTPGAPAGSHALSDFDNVNLFNGNLAFHLPLVGVSGRGEVGMQSTLDIEQRWRVEHYFYQYGYYYINSANYNWWTGIKPGYGAGALVGRTATLRTTDCYIYGQYETKADTIVTRLTFTTPDGTEYELHDQLNDGRPISQPCVVQGASRGTGFVTWDGTAATFISDTTIYDDVNAWSDESYSVFYPSGYLLLRDGTRYRIDTGLVTWMQDRNGNRLTFTYDNNGANYQQYNRVIAITDSLNRQVTISYDVQDVSPYGLCDKITFSGFGGAPRTIRVSHTNLANALRAGFSLSTDAQLFPELNGSCSYCYTNPVVASAVWLPDGTAYKFYYNNYAELARVELPTGGTYEYDYAAGIINAPASGAYIPYGGGAQDQQIYRRVVEKRVYANGSTLTTRITFSRPESMSSNGTVQSTGAVTQDVLDSGGALQSRSNHYFRGFSTDGAEDATGFIPWQKGVQYKTEDVDSNGTTVLRSEEKTRQQRAHLWWWSGWAAQFGPNPGADGEPALDPRVVTTTTTVEPSGANLVSKQTALSPVDGSVGFDQFNNPTDTWEYDYGPGAAPTYAVHHTHTDFLTTNAINGIDYTSQSGAHIRNLPRASQTYAVNPQTGAETLVAQSEVRYDEYGLAGYGSVAGWTDPSTAARGNATTTRRWLDTSNTWLESHASYDQVGNAVSATDPRGITSYVSYADSFSDGVGRGAYAFPTSTTSAIPDPTGQRGSSTPLTTSTVYDYSTGLVYSATDANSKTTSLQYNDALDRLTRVDRPDGGWTTYSYGTSMSAGLPSDYVRTLTALDAARSVESYQFFDGLGRKSRTFLNLGGSPATFSTTDTQYDALGRVWRVSNPYYTGGSADAVNPSGRWTTTTYDSLGRVKTLTTPDSAAVTTDYIGNGVKVTDQAGKTRLSFSDALGRLTDVWEITPSDQWTQSISFGGQSLIGYHTFYEYDALGNLRRVDQGAQQRFFMYDSLSRLIRAKNPEQAAGSVASNITDPVTGNSQWSMAYGYDSNDNLTARVDARDIWTYYTYDNLNRNTLVDYSNTASNPDVDRHYDNPTAGSYGRGRYYYDFYNKDDGTIDHQAVDSYDVMGRPRQRRQVFYANGQWYQYPVTRTYDLSGNVTAQTYPSGHTVSYSYDAAGRLADNAGYAAFSGNLGDGAQRTYATGIRYDEANRLQTEQFGTQTPLYHKLHYNVRGQLYDVRLSTVAWQPGGAGEWDWNRGAIVNYYSQNDINAQTNAARFNSGAENNGNLLRSEHWVPTDPNASYDGVYTAGSAAATRDEYGYDALNRLAWMIESPFTSSTGFTQYDIAQTNNYDVYGNRTLDVDKVCGGSQTLGTRYFVENLYQVILGRGSDFGGLSAWNGYLRGGYGQDMLARAQATVAGFFHSPEYVNRNRSDRDYVRDLYLAYLNREPDQAGWDAWTATVPTCGRECVLQGFANSSEFANHVTTLCPSGMTFGAGNPKDFGVDASTNRLSVPANQAGTMAYDPAGNLYIDTYSGQAAQRTYDAENRMTMEQSSVTSIINRYTYDADGHRVKRDVNGQVTWQVYGFDGELLAEYTGGAAPASPQREYGYRSDELLVSAQAGGQVQWVVPDHLGTPRMNPDGTGSLAGVSRHDYLPFGEELGVNVGGRAQAQGYGQTENVRQKFTSKERDDETGLDFFGARYYASTQGRFTSPDEFAGDPIEVSELAEEASKNPVFYAELTKPQSLNKYQYCYNNPLRFADPDGHQGEEALEWLASSPAGEWLSQNADKIINVAGAAATTAIIAASGAGKELLKYASEHPAKSAAMQDMEDLRFAREHLYRNQNNSEPKEVTVDADKHPESARHVEEAQKAGHPDTLTVDRGGARARRRESLRGTPRAPGKDRDEYPPAVTREGGSGASVRPISPRDNRGSGSSLGRQIRNVPNGGRIRIRVVRKNREPS